MGTAEFVWIAADRARREATGGLLIGRYGAPYGGPAAAGTRRSERADSCLDSLGGYREQGCDNSSRTADA